MKVCPDSGRHIGERSVSYRNAISRKSSMFSTYPHPLRPQMATEELRDDGVRPRCKSLNMAPRLTISSCHSKGVIVTGHEPQFISSEVVPRLEYRTGCGTCLFFVHNCATRHIISPLLGYSLECHAKCTFISPDAENLRRARSILTLRVINY